MLIQAGKEGRILVLNRDNLGGYVSGANTNALQDIPPQVTPQDGGVIPQSKGFWSTAAYWNGNVYLWAENNVPMLFKLSDGVLSTQPDSTSSITSAFPDPSFSVSSNGTENGIAWAVRADQFNTHGPAVLYAWDANDLTSTLYESDTNSKRDAAGAANKFSIPIVTNGKVYVAANGEVDVYGLFNGEPNAAAPVISPDGGSFRVEPECSAFQHHGFRQHLLHSGRFYAHSVIHPLHRSDHDQYRYNDQGARQRARIRAERRKHSDIQLHQPDTGGSRIACRRNLSHRSNGHSLGQRSERQNLLHHRWLDAVCELQPVYRSNPDRALGDTEGRSPSIPHFKTAISIPRPTLS